MISESQTIPTEKVDVEVELDDGQVLIGAVFIAPQGRLTDMLNDERAFMPFETADGRFMAVRKTALRSLAPLAQERTAYEGINPFEILGLRSDAGLEEARQAYRRLVAENDPDRLNGMGLSREHIELANVRMARINDAYRRIQKTFAEGSAADAA